MLSAFFVVALIQTVFCFRTKKVIFQFHLSLKNRQQLKQQEHLAMQNTFLWRKMDIRI